MKRLANAFRSTGLIAAALSLASCQPPQRNLQDARDAIAATLPAPYFEDLVTESASVEGHRLVLLVRSPEGDAAKTRQHEQFGELRQSEQQQMHALCELPAIRPLFGTDAILVRRFVDRKGGVFFEAELPVRDCAGGDTEGTRA